MEKYSENESMLFNIDQKIENRPEFKKMLNNLLGIANRDNAVFMSIKISNFDLKTLLDEKDFNKVLNNESFTVEIKNVQDNVVIKDLELTDNFDDFINITDLNGIPVSITNRILLEKDFLNHKEILFNMVDAKRFKHSIATGILAIKYAKQLNYDLKKAWFAGTTHDITKSKSEAWHRGFLASVGQKGFETPKHNLHSLSGYHWLKEKYKIEDEQILNAVKNHTNLAENLSVLDKIIYAADKLSQGRKFIGIQAIREIITKDFEKRF